MSLVVLPCTLYLIFHLLGWYYPDLLWGVDQLYYYPHSIGIGFCLAVVAGLIVATPCSWRHSTDRLLGGMGKRLAGPFLANRWGKWLMPLFFLVLAYNLRVRTHHLGDSEMWFRTLELSLSRSQEFNFKWIRGIEIGGLHIPVFESLDFVIHFVAYRLGRLLSVSWTPRETYEWISYVSGAGYVVLLWRIAALLHASLSERLTVFALLCGLGSIQLFLGYGESYTLVSLAGACYVLASLRTLQGHSLSLPSLCLAIACGLHLIAASLIPSWIYLLWYREGWRVPAALKEPRIYIPLIVLGASVGLSSYALFYPNSLPLWQSAEEGKYTLFSPWHLLNLLNAVLLLSPFGLFWGVVLSFRKPAFPASRFLMWATIGTATLVFLHDAFLGGRDWDLMSFPGLFYTL